MPSFSHRDKQPCRRTAVPVQPGYRYLLRCGLMVSSTLYALRTEAAQFLAAISGHERRDRDGIGDGDFAPLQPPSAPAHSRRELFFIDRDVADPGAFWLAAPRGTTVLCIPAQVDAWQFMAAEAARFRGLGAIHIISHGEPGALVLNGRRTVAADLDARRAELQQLGRALSKNGDILLYGCDTGQGLAGAHLVARLADFTGADVAASLNRTGARDSADWNLELRSGEIDTAIAAPSAYDHTLATITVTSNADSGPGTLRQAIIDASNGDTINFNAAMTISLTTVASGNLLTIHENLTIDGDVNNDGTPDVTLSAQNKGRVLEVTSGTVTLDGLILTNGLLSGNGGGFGGIIGGDALGAGLAVNGVGTKVTVLHSTITANASSGGGGGGSGNGSYNYGGGGGGGRSSIGGGNGGNYNGSTPGGTGLNGTGGIGGHNGTSAQSGKGGSTTGGAGGSVAGGFVAGGNGATAGPGGGSSIGGGGGGAGASGGATGGRGGHAAGAIFVGSGAAAYLASSTVSNNWGAGGGGGGGYSSAGGAGGDGTGAVRVVGTFKYDNTSMTFSNNSGVGGSGGGSNSIGGANGNSTNNIRSAGGTVDPNWTPPNAAPSLALDGGSLAFSENGSAAQISSGATASDAEGNWDGGTLAVQISSNAQASDTLAIGTASGLTVSGVNLLDGATTIATLSASGGSVTNNTTLTVTFNSNATNARVQNAVRAFTFANSSDDPSTSTRTVTFTLADAAAASTQATRTVIVSSINDAPIVTTSGGTTAFTEDSGVSSNPVIIDSALTLSDADNSTLASGTVSITGNFQSSQDVLAFTNTSSALFGNISASYNSTTGILTLTSAGATATVAQWLNALNAVTYINSSNNPNTSTRTISFVVNDGIDNSSAGTKSVSVSSANDSPVVAASGGTTAFTEGNNTTSTPVAIDSGLTLSDADNSTLASATVSITGNFQSGQDVLAFANTSSGLFGNITASYNASTGVLTLISAGATATVAQWQNALNAVTYTNSSESPNTSTRTVSFVANDGSIDSSAGTKSVSVSSTNDSPVVAASGGTTAFTEGNNTPSTPVAVDSGLTLSDADHSTLASGSVAITGNLQTAEDLLAFTNDGSTMGNLVGSYTAGTGVLALTSAGATATLAEWQAALRAVTYTNSSDAPNTSARTVSFVVNDGSNDSAASTKSVSVAAVNDTPTDLALSASSVNQSAGVNATVGTLSTTDVDSASFAYSLVSGTGDTHNASFNLSSSTLRANDAGALAAGSYSVRILTHDGTSGYEEAFTITLVDNVAPAAPPTPDLATASDSGGSATDDITNSTTPTFTGTAEANSTVELFRGGSTSLGTTIANGSGNWSFTIGSALAAGTYSITAKATDAGTNTSAASAALSITIDTTAPAAPALATITTDTGASGTDLITSDTTLVLSGTAEASSTVSVSRLSVGTIGTATADGSGNFSFDYTATTLGSGTHTFTVIATDLAGNASAASASFLVEIDADTPSAPIISAISTDTGTSSSDGITNDQTLTFSGTAEANSTVTISRSGVGTLGTAAADGSGAWTFDYTATTLAGGSYLFSATTRDNAGNISAASADFAVTVDTSAPSAPAITAISADTGASSTDQITSDRTLVLSGTAEANAAVTVSRTGTGIIGNATADGSGAWTFDYTATTLAPSAYTFTAIVTDVAGNAGAASADFVVTIADPPAIAVNPTGGAHTIGGSFTLTVSANGTGPFTYQWYLGSTALTDSANRTGSTSASLVHTGIDATFAGDYTVVVTNLAGSATSAVASITINKASQTITFPALADKLPTDAPFKLSASASSGLPVSFAVISGPAAISASTVTLTGAGVVTIRASQAGDNNYLAAPDVDRSFTVAPLAPVITSQPVGGIAREGESFTFTSGVAGQAVSYQWTFQGTPIPGATSASLTLSNLTLAQQGGYAVTVSNTTGSVTSSTATLTVIPATSPVGGVFFGTFAESGDFAVFIGADGAGFFAGYLPEQRVGYYATFKLEADGSFVAGVDESAAIGGASIQQESEAPQFLAVTRTLRGRAIGGAFTATIEGPDLSLTASQLPVDGPTAGIAGFYSARREGTVTGAAYAVAGAQGQIFVLIVDAGEPTGGRSTVSSDGDFSLATSVSAVQGNIIQVSRQIELQATPTGSFTPEIFGGLRVDLVRTDRLLNLSSRLRAGTGARTFISGFFIDGSTPKSVLIRGIGPALAQFGVPDPLAQPILRLYRGQEMIAEARAWGNQGNVADLAATSERVGAFRLPAGSLDAAMLQSLPPGPYTAQVTGADGGTGTSLVEIYDASAAVGRLINISTRGEAGQGADLVIAGFVVTGNIPKRLLVRVVGPTLATFGIEGALSNPVLRVVDRIGQTVAENDDWGLSEPDVVSAATAQVGGFVLPAGSRDASVVVTLPPGAYTALGSGKDGLTGIVLIEVYEIP